MNLDLQPEFILFLDRGMSVNLLVAELQELVVPFVRHDDIFPQNTPDIVWLTAVGKAGWFVLTADQRIRYNPLEKQALLAGGVGSFILVAKNLPGRQIAASIVRALPAMRAFAARTPRPFIAKIYADGRVQALQVS